MNRGMTRAVQPRPSSYTIAADKPMTASPAKCFRFSKLKRKCRFMRVHTPLLLLALVLPLTAFAQFDYDRHVAFDNSLTSGSFYYSQCFFIGPRERDLAHHKFTVSETARA